MFMSELINMLHSSTIKKKKTFCKARVKQMLAEFKIYSEVHSGTTTRIMQATLLDCLKGSFERYNTKR